jgi:hypothetical protein
VGANGTFLDYRIANYLHGGQIISVSDVSIEPSFALLAFIGKRAPSLLKKRFYSQRGTVIPGC